MAHPLYSEGSIKRSLHTYLSFKILNFILAFVFQIVVAKILSPAEFATYAVLLAALMAGERALSFGIDRTVLRFVPALTRSHDVAGLRRLALRLLSLRLAALCMLMLIGIFGAQFIASILPIQLDGRTLFAFLIWFVAYTFTADADALAQSWIAHFESAVAATAEIVARTTFLFLLAASGAANVQNIVMTCAVTSTCAMILMVYRLSFFVKALMPHGTASHSNIEGSTFDPQGAPKFALANFSSTITYLISSPPVIRIIASAGLDFVALAAFSFTQGLYISLQRVFPGLLVLPTLEPIIMSQLGSDLRGDRVYAGLSLLYKAELACILIVLIATSVAGAEIVEILSRPAYAPYYYILPVLVGSLVLITSYRVLELIANTAFMQHIFFWLWPLSLVSMLAMYATIGSLGVVSVLFWPILEIIVRVGFLAFLLRHHRVWCAFDPRRSILMLLNAAGIISFLLALRSHPSIHHYHLDLALATIGVIGFLLSFFVIRPLRSLEYEMLVLAIPESFSMIRKIASIATRR